MGRKITIDSATLMNKGLEVIEARWLFGVAADRIEVLVHPQSVVHSMVEFVDGTVLAQLGVTDMRLPIQYALSYPERWAGRDPRASTSAAAMRLDFEVPDHDRFPCLSLAYRALAGAGALPAVLNAANEEAVAAFLDERVAFTAIPETIREVMDEPDRASCASWTTSSPPTLGARAHARSPQARGPSETVLNGSSLDHTAVLHRRPRDHHLLPRVRPLHHRQGVRDARLHLLVRLREAPRSASSGATRTAGSR